MSRRSLLALPLLLAAPLLLADGPGDNDPTTARPIPPPGIAVPAADRDDLRARLDALGQEIVALRKSVKPALRDLLPDVEVYHKAVRYALLGNDFYAPGDVAAARDLLVKGTERAAQLRAGKAPWTTATGLVVRGFVSKIDGSVQPYGLVVPKSYRPDSPHRHRLDVWLHGRNERTLEVQFMEQRQRSAGEFTPPHAFVLHPFGRYSNAFKFAGEIDVLEALAHVMRHYAIDDDRLVMRGFSMGGAGCWQFAVHYPSKWCAAAPGAGFSETTEFLKEFQKEDYRPTAYDKKLLHLYDCTDYAGNLFNCPTVAYSGTKDPQKQAADMMEKAMDREGLTLLHVLGPDTEHKYHPRAKEEEINRRIDAIAARGRLEVPRRVNLTTWTLRYNRCAWVTIDGLERHWEAASAEAEWLPSWSADRRRPMSIASRNVTALTLSFAPGACPLEISGRPSISINGDRVRAAPVLSDRSWVAHFRKIDGKWQAVKSADDGKLRKRHGLQGPIDDAFMDSFLMVRPTGKPLNDKVGAWAKEEMAHAVEHWRKQFRGDARVKDDVDVAPEDIRTHNLVLWGDPSSNKLLQKVLPKLPVAWDAKAVRLGGIAHDAAHSMPVLIYPNPLSPTRYVVLNSGFTYREYDYLNNARQVPKLPDYAVLDVRTPPSVRLPGKVAEAGFFDEEWRLPPAKE